MTENMHCFSLLLWLLHLIYFSAPLISLQIAPFTFLYSCIDPVVYVHIFTLHSSDGEVSTSLGGLLQDLEIDWLDYFKATVNKTVFLISWYVYHL